MGDQKLSLREMLDIGEQWLLAIGYFAAQAFVAAGGVQHFMG